MMTLDEVMEHEEEVAEEYDKLCKANDSFNFSQLRWKECANEHRQLAEWLKELKQLREQEPVLDQIKAEIKELDGRYVIGDYGIYGENIPKYVRFCDVLQIIDKYKAESEGVWHDLVVKN